MTKYYEFSCKFVIFCHYKVDYDEYLYILIVICFKIDV